MEVGLQIFLVKLKKSGAAASARENSGAASSARRNYSYYGYYPSYGQNNGSNW